MPTLISFLVRLLLLAAGLVMAACIASVMVLLAALWFLRAAWCRLTGRPVSPFVMGTGPRAAFDEMMRHAQGQQAGSRTPRADAASGVRRPLATDVTDVEPK